MSTSKRAPADQERFVILLRHGIAEDATDGMKDADRALTSEGHQKMKEIARGLARIIPKVDAIYTSPLVRAVQTAQRVAKAYRSRVKLVTTDALRPGASLKDVRALLTESKAKRMIFVGHEPTLTEILRAFTSLGAKAQLDLKKGGCYGIRILENGKAVLEWILTPRISRRISASRGR